MSKYKQLLGASQEQLSKFFKVVAGENVANMAERQRAYADRLGLNTSMLLCGVGFNRNTWRVPDVARALGFDNLATLESARNNVFVRDIYSALSAENTVPLYGAMRRIESEADFWCDLIRSRISFLQGRLEDTINPVLISGLKYEMRAIYENRLASPEFVAWRLSPELEVLRTMTGEIQLMLVNEAISAQEFLDHEGVNAEEKRTAVFEKLLPAEMVEKYITGLKSVEERFLLREALAQDV